MSLFYLAIALLSHVIHLCSIAGGFGSTGGNMTPDTQTLRELRQDTQVPKMSESCMNL